MIHPWAFEFHELTLIMVIFDNVVDDQLFRGIVSLIYD